jgi:hypothetical protein
MECVVLESIGWRLKGDRSGGPRDMAMKGKARLRDRIDAIIAHEYEEDRLGTHELARQHGAKTKLPVSEGARRILKAMGREVRNDSRTRSHRFVRGSQKIGRGRARPHGRPPRGSVRAELPHTALTSGVWRKTARSDRAAGSWGEVSSDRRASGSDPTSSARANSVFALRVASRVRSLCGMSPGPPCCPGLHGS